MAKALDISRRPRPRSSPAPPRPVYSKRNKFNFVTFLLFVFVIIVLIFFISSFNSSSNSSNSSSKSSRATTPPATSLSPTANPPASPTITNTPNKIKIQILNGSGIASVPDKMKNLIQSKGYKIESISKAQLEYSQTTVYYRANFASDAKLLSIILKDYQPALSLTQSSDLFDILIIIGKDNLPQE